MRSRGCSGRVDPGLGQAEHAEADPAEQARQVFDRQLADLVFQRLQGEGVIAPGVRFQVCLPAPHSAIDGFFEDNSQWPDLYRASPANVKFLGIPVLFIVAPLIGGAAAGLLARLGLTQPD